MARVIIDGVEVEATVTIVTDAQPEPAPEPVPGPIPEPSPEPAPEPVQPPAGVKIQPPIDWANPGGRRVVDIPQGRILSFPFRATNNPDESGSVVISEVVGYELVTRRLWISEAPGGAPLSPVYRSSAEGVSAQNIKWSQRYNRFRCHLVPGNSYYLNITNTHGCESSCQAYLSFLR